jgi:hypothetical protein
VCLYKKLFFALTIFTYSCTNNNIDICKCLNNATYYNSNENRCDKAINKELGHNWKTTNYSQEPDKSAKFDKLVDRCK